MTTKTPRIYSWEREIAKRYQEGVTVPEIMEATARTEQAVRRALGKCGVPLRDDSPADRLEVDEALLREREAPVAVADFAALVAELVTELTEADTEHFAALTAQDRTVAPAAFANYPWAGEQITLAEMAPLVNTTLRTLGYYNQRANRARRRGQPYDPQRFPPSATPQPRPGEFQRWAAGDIALWRAIHESRLLRKPRAYDDSELRPVIAKLDAQPGGTSRRRLNRELGIGEVRAGQLLAEIRAERAGAAPGPSPGQVEARQLAVARKAVAELGAVRATDLQQILAKAGWPDVSIRRCRALLGRARQGSLPLMEPATMDGLVYAPTIARALGISPWFIHAAVRAGRLTPAEPKPRQVGGHQLWVFNPATMTMKYPWKGPVDKNYERCPHCRAGLHLTPAGRFPPHERTIKGERRECEGSGVRFP